MVRVNNKEMKSPVKFENDFHDLSKAEKVILAIILGLVTLVVISWASQGFACNETRSTEPGSDLSQTFGYKASTTANTIYLENEMNET
jgi:hypothetical protein